MPKTYTHTFSLPANVGLGIVSLTRTLTSLDSQTTFLFYVTDSVHIPLCYMSVHVTASTHIHLPTYIHKHLPIVFLYISVTSWGKGEFDWATINMFWQLERGGEKTKNIFYFWMDRWRYFNKTWSTVKLKGWKNERFFGWQCWPEKSFFALGFFSSLATLMLKTSVTRKNRQMSIIKVAQKWFH